MLTLLLFAILLCKTCAQITTNNFHVRVEAGTRSCFYEKGHVGQMMEIYYQVVDGQHGDLDITLEITDPSGARIVTDHKKPENSIIKDLSMDGDYSFCFDNSYSKFNSKLVYIYVTMENQEDSTDAVVTVEEDGQEAKEVMTWVFEDADEPYQVEVAYLADTLTRTLKHVVKARHVLDVYAAGKSRDSYLAFEGTFVVDAWSGFQISFMCLVGLLQVFMIKKLFKTPVSKC